MVFAAFLAFFSLFVARGLRPGHVRRQVDGDAFFHHYHRRHAGRPAEDGQAVGQCSRFRG